MGNVNWAVGSQLDPRQVLVATRVASGSAVNSTPFDLRTVEDGSRVALILTAFGTGGGNTGGTWTVNESATSGGSYTAAKLDGSLAATPAAATSDIQRVSVYPNPAKPFVRVTFTPANASAAVDIATTLVVVPRARV